MNHLDSDYFVTCSKTGDQFAGRHILADFWDVERMGDLDFIKETIEESDEEERNKENGNRKFMKDS